MAMAREIIVVCIIVLWASQSYGQAMTKEHKLTVENNSTKQILDYIANQTHKYAITNEVHFLITTLTRFVKQNKSTIKKEHLDKTMNLVQSEEIEVGTLEYTRLQLITAVLETTQIKNELEYIYATRRNGFHEILSDIQLKFSEFEKYIRHPKDFKDFEESDKKNMMCCDDNYLLMVYKEMFDMLNKDQRSMAGAYMREKMAPFIDMARWELLAKYYNQDYHDGNLCATKN